MEKFGLFDLIDKFNAVANGKNDFAKRKDNSSQAANQTFTGDANGNQSNGGNGANGGLSKGGNGANGSDLANGNAQQKLVDPQIFPPPQYMMNAKLREFNKKHEEFSRRILPPQ